MARRLRRREQAKIFSMMLDIALGADKFSPLPVVLVPAPPGDTKASMPVVRYLPYLDDNNGIAPATEHATWESCPFLRGIFFALSFLRATFSERHD